MELPYANRYEAGQVLAEELRESYADRDDVLVLALPRGGVPVAYEVARALHAPLDLMLVRKLGFPGQEELAMGAIATGGVQVLNEELVERGGVAEDMIQTIVERETSELQRREQAYRGDRPQPDVRDKQIILIDDGLATGSTMLAAVKALRQRQSARVIVAVPVAPPDSVALVDREVDQVVCPATPADFGGVGRWYEDFSQTSDEEVRALLEEAWKEQEVRSTRTPSR